MNIVTKHFLRKLKYSHFLCPRDAARRIRLVKEHKIDVILDVGANIGQYGSIMRALGFRERIISFEPLSGAYRGLCTLAGRDSKWDTHNIGLGDSDIEATINVSENLQSSSILNMMPKHLRVAPESKYVNSEKITVRTLNQVLPDVISANATTYLKIDTQGYEKKVLQGADKVLDRITGVQLEISLVPMYDQEALIDELIPLLYDNGFVIMSIEPGLHDPTTGQLLQMEGVFFRG